MLSDKQDKAAFRSAFDFYKKHKLEPLKTGETWKALHDEAQELIKQQDNKLCTDLIAAVYSELIRINSPKQ